MADPDEQARMQAQIMAAPGQALTPAQISIKVTRGKRPHPVPKARGVRPPQLVGLMQRCWHQDPAQRPTFPEIVRELTELKAASGMVWSPSK